MNATAKVTIISEIKEKNAFYFQYKTRFFMFPHTKQRNVGNIRDKKRHKLHLGFSPKWSL